MAHKAETIYIPLGDETFLALEYNYYDNTQHIMFYGTKGTTPLHDGMPFGDATVLRTFHRVGRSLLSKTFYRSDT